MLQRFAKKNFTPPFALSQTPRLAYISRAPSESGVSARVMHAHPDLVEFVLITAGQGEYSVGGRRYQIRRGDLLVYNSGVIHDETLGESDGLCNLCCAVAGLAIDGLRPNAFLAERQRPLFHLEEADFQAIRQFYELMFDLLVSGRAGGEESCHYLMLALLTACWDVARGGDAGRALPDDNVLSHRIKAYIDEHYAEELSLATLSDELGVSLYYLSHVFKEETGYSPLQYLLRRRIGEAQTLLLTTDTPITQIASQVGYENPSHFNRLFVKNVGMSPRDYRRNYVMHAPDAPDRKK